MTNTLVFGSHASKQFLVTARDRVKEVLLQKGPSAERIRASLELADLPLQYLDKKKLDEVCGGGRHQGIALRIVPKLPANEKELPGFLEDVMQRQASPLFLVLDNILDPHNLGACLRSAAAANVDAVVLPKDKSAEINATVRKVAVGAVESLDIFVVSNLARSLDTLKKAGIWLTGMALDEQAQDFYQGDLRGPLAIVMGSEGDGLRRLTREKCDFLCYLPMPGNMQSLNVSVATGICLFEALRQRQQAQSV